MENQKTNLYSKSRFSYFASFFLLFQKLRKIRFLNHDIESFLIAIYQKVDFPILKRFLILKHYCTTLTHFFSKLFENGFFQTLL